MRGMYDPIGLGVKPLLLEMLKSTLDTPSPSQELTVVGLYGKYVNKTLIEKIVEIKRGDILTESPSDPIKTLMAILQEIAIYLQRRKREWVDLNAWSGENRRRWADVLWATTDEGPSADMARDGEEEEDATTRIGTRGLLTRVDTRDAGATRAVDFYHRSVREYFVALGVVASLRHGIRDVIALLLRTPLNHEIVDFVAGLLRNETGYDVEGRLADVIRAASQRRGTRAARIGGQCLTILYRMTSSVPGDDWRSLALNGADLSGADLSGKNFAGSTLREARFDNVNLDHANLCDCDLRGSTIEETAPVEAICVKSDHSFCAAYSDGAIREWTIGHTGTATRRIVLAESSSGVDRMGVQPTGELWLLTKAGDMVFHSWNSRGSLERNASFPIRRDLAELGFYGDKIAALEEVKSRRVTPVLIDPAESKRICVGPESPAVFCALVGERNFVVFDRDQGLVLIAASAGEGWHRTVIDKGPVSALASRSLSVSEHVVAGGYETGEMRLWSVRLEHARWAATEIGQYQAHNGMVTSIVFLNDEMVLSGGRDRAIAMAGFDRMRPRLLWGPRHLSLTLRCSGLSIGGLQGPREQELLSRLIAAASSGGAR
jgi:hypothetical protein